MLLAVGAIFLLTVYGVRRLRGQKCGRGALQPGIDRDPDDYRLQALHALNAEFRETGTRPEYLKAGGAVECPCCGAAYPAGTLYCECGTETVEMETEEEPEEEQKPPEEYSSQSEDETASAPSWEGPDPELVVVHIAESHWKASLLKSLLEANDIPCVTGGNVPSTVYQFPNMPLGEVRLFVREQDLEQAREILDQCR